MSQRLLKCTICGSEHSIFHCINKCGVCSGDNRQCSCPAQPPQKKKRNALQSNQQPEDKPNYQELKKQTKSEAIKTLQTKLADAKKTIAELKAELKTLRQRTADEPQQQPQQKDAKNLN